MKSNSAPAQRTLSPPKLSPKTALSPSKLPPKRYWTPPKQRPKTTWHPPQQLPKSRSATGDIGPSGDIEDPNPHRNPVQVRRAWPYPNMSQSKSPWHPPQQLPKSRSAGGDIYPTEEEELNLKNRMPHPHPNPVQAQPIWPGSNITLSNHWPPRLPPKEIWDPPKMPPKTIWDPPKTPPKIIWRPPKRLPKKSRKIKRASPSLGLPQNNITQNAQSSTTVNQQVAVSLSSEDLQIDLLELGQRHDLRIGLPLSSLREATISHTRDLRMEQKLRLGQLSPPPPIKPSRRQRQAQKHLAPSLIARDTEDQDQEPARKRPRLEREQQHGFENVLLGTAVAPLEETSEKFVMLSELEWKGNGDDKDIDSDAGKLYGDGKLYDVDDWSWLQDCADESSPVDRRPPSRARRAKKSDNVPLRCSTRQVMRDITHKQGPGRGAGATAKGDYVTRGSRQAMRDDITPARTSRTDRLGVLCEEVSEQAPQPQKIGLIADQPEDREEEELGFSFFDEEFSRTVTDSDGEMSDKLTYGFTGYEVGTLREGFRRE